MTTGPKPKSLEQIWNELLAEATYTDDGCILVMKGHPIGIGYKARHFNRRTWFVHHIADFIARGKPPNGTVRRHTCDKPNCINIEHILRGTHGDNVADMISKGRNARGHKHPNVQINGKQVREIREKIKNGESYARLSEEYGISRGGIHNIGTRRSWAWLK